MFGFVDLDETVTDRDIGDVVSSLSLSAVQLLYEKLEIPYTDVEKQEENAGCRDPDIKARYVLRYWRQINGKKATRRRLLEALKICKFIKAMETLEKRWYGTAKQPAHRYSLVL